LLFDLLDRINPGDAFAAPPGTSLTPLDATDGPGQDGQALFNQGLWTAFPPGPGPKPVQAAPAAASADPERGWQTADAYLSGNVKRKLATAERATVAESRFQRNVEALQLVIPVDIAPGQIEVRLGTHWIPPADVNQFRAEVLDAEEPRWSRSGKQFFNYVALSGAESRAPITHVQSMFATLTWKGLSSAGV